MAPNPYIWQMVRQAIEALGGQATHAEIRSYVQKHWPTANDGSVSAHINLCAVNAVSRVQYPPNSKPRPANGHYDFLYKLDRGLYALYDPKRHGLWEIYKGPNGKPKVGKVQRDTAGATTPPPAVLVSPLPAPAREPRDTGFLFPLERHLREFLAANIRSVKVRGATLTLYSDNTGQLGVEYPTAVGPIDLLAVDSEGNFYVFELKLGRGLDAAMGQLSRYMGWVKTKLAGDRRVTGVIVSQTIGPKLRYAAMATLDVALFEYSFSFQLRPADGLQ